MAGNGACGGEDASPASFSNTVLPIQLAEHTVDQAEALLRHVRHTAAFPEHEATLAELVALRGLVEDELAWHPALFARVAEVADQASLSNSERRTCHSCFQAMRQAGGDARTAKLASLKAINAELVALEARFEANLLADVARLHTPVDDGRMLAGLDDAMVDLLRREAKARGSATPFCVPCARPVVDAILSKAQNRDFASRSGACGPSAAVYPTRRWSRGS